jgi:hypothetical protein
MFSLWIPSSRSGVGEGVGQKRMPLRSNVVILAPDWTRSNSIRGWVRNTKQILPNHRDHLAQPVNQNSISHQSHKKPCRPSFHNQQRLMAQPHSTLFMPLADLVGAMSTQCVRSHPRHRTATRLNRVAYVKYRYCRATLPAVQTRKMALDDWENGRFGARLNWVYLYGCKNILRSAATNIVIR